jgi:hypothetical protein
MNVYVYRYVSLYAYMQTCIEWMCIYICMRAYEEQIKRPHFMDTHAYTYGYAHAHTYGYLHAYKYGYMHAYTYARISAHMQKHHLSHVWCIYTFTHTKTHSLIHAYIHMCMHAYTYVTCVWCLGYQIYMHTHICFMHAYMYLICVNILNKLHTTYVHACMHTYKHANKNTYLDFCSGSNNHAYVTYKNKHISAYNTHSLMYVHIHISEFW